MTPALPQNSLSTSTRRDGVRDLDGRSSGRVSQLHSVGDLMQALPTCLLTGILTTALHYPYILAFEPTFVEVRHVETGHLVQIIPGNHIRCLFADSPPSQIHTPQGPLIPYRNVPGGPPGFAGSYGPNQQGNSYGPPRPPGPPPPRIRNQIIFVSDEGNVQVVRLAPPGPTPHRPSQSGSVSRR
jgi:hypothetical protein